jgi:hypothetical protein
MTESDLVAPQGFEPRLIGSEPTVLPLNEGAAAHPRPQIQPGNCANPEPGATLARRILYECTHPLPPGQSRSGIGDSGPGNCPDQYFRHVCLWL